jgi:hypothetical protein
MLSQPIFVRLKLVLQAYNQAKTTKTSLAALTGMSAVSCKHPYTSLPPPKKKQLPNLNLFINLLELEIDHVTELRNLHLFLGPKAWLQKWLVAAVVEVPLGFI